MEERKSINRIFLNLDWIIISMYLLLAVIGCFSIYGASYNFESSGLLNMSEKSGKQFIWIIVSVFTGICILIIKSDGFYTWAPMLYFFMLGLLVLTIFIAPDIKGSHSWLVLGPVRIQPAEFAKPVTALILARYMSNPDFSFTRIRNVITVSAFLLVPVLFILLQRETGSALVFISFLLMFYREGMSGYILFLGFIMVFIFVIALKYGRVLIWGYTNLGIFIALLSILVLAAIIMKVYSCNKNHIRIFFLSNIVVILAGILFNALGLLNFNIVYLQTVMFLCSTAFFVVSYFFNLKKVYLGVSLFILGFSFYSFSTGYVFNNILEPHQQMRVKVLLGLEQDINGAGYNVNQSKIAIGSGGFTGKGFLNGTQTKLKYVPEQSTDFIFCTIGEEQGFVGSVAVLGLYLILLLRIIFVSEKATSSFVRIYGYSIAGIIFFHVLVNIGMVIGIMPVIGIPLPFISYGGSSMLSFSILLFIFLRMSAENNCR